MTSQIFITGVTGYIGGDILYALDKAHPEYEYTAIVRNSEQGAKVAAAYPKIRLVYGNLDDAALLQAESARADIVIHTADSSDHEGAAKAIAKGIAEGHTSTRPGFWLHLSGTGILTWKDTETHTYGEPPSQPAYDDLEHVSSLTSLPDAAFHRDIDKLVLGAASAAVKTAIVCPPTIYGRGRGPAKQRSRQAYDLALVTLTQGQGVQIGRGLTEWDNVHVADLSDFYVRLVEAATARDAARDAELWGERGYFLVENGHHVWGEVSRWVADAAFERGYIKSREVRSITAEEIMEILGGFQGVSWGLNSKGHAKRARKYLGWDPKGRSLRDEIPTIVDDEAERLGLKAGHAAKVAGAST